MRLNTQFFTRAFLVLSLAVASVSAADSQATTPSITELFVFTASGLTFPNGSSPGPIIQASDGNFYGTAGILGQCDPSPCSGTIFKFTPDGQFTTLYTFGYGGPAAPFANGAMPVGVVEGPDGYLYGTTFAGGNGGSASQSSGYGTVFKISKTGEFHSLHSFCFDGPCEEGYRPSRLVLGRDGKFYGTTLVAGSNHASSKGTIFRVSTAGVLETLHYFDGFADGGAPVAGLVQGSDGNFYGTTSGGGSTQYAVGTVFRITPAGVYTVLHTFQLGPPNPTKDGQASKQALIQACHGKLYGVTSLGGLYQAGTVFEIGLDGSQYSTLFDITKPLGRFPNELLLATDGNLWGSNIIDTGVYTISTAGVLAPSLIPYVAACGPNGPGAPLIQAKDGKLYGTMPICGNLNGTSGSGSIFSIDAGLPKPLAPSVAAVTNGASFATGGIVAGELASIFGVEIVLSPGIHSAPSLPLPTVLEKVSVYVNGIASPLVAVVNVNGQQQINFQVPFEVAGHSTATIQVENNCRISATITVPVLDAQPGVFSYVVGGSTYGAILHANYQLVSTAHPAKAGETVLIYANGLGTVSSPPKDGAQSNGEVTILKPTVTIGGKPAKVRFSGLAPGFVGLNQINADVPEGLAPGNQPVVITSDEVSSVSVMLPVQ